MVNGGQLFRATGSIIVPLMHPGKVICTESQKVQVAPGVIIGSIP